MSVEISMDKASLDNFNKQMDQLKKDGVTSLYTAICDVSLRIRNFAMERLKGRGHVKSTRLRNSVFVKAKNQKDVTKNGNNVGYSANGKSYNADLKSVTLNDYETAVGTNVEYADAIEHGSKPHVIEAKNYPSLGNKKVGFFGKRVNHPGYGGDSFLDWALKNVDVTKTTADLMRENMRKKYK